MGLGAVWANRAFFSGLRVVLALELSTYFTIFPVRALQVWVTLCSSWNLHTDCKESIGRFICPSVAGGMSWPLLQISTSWFPYFFAGLHVSWAPYTLVSWEAGWAECFILWKPNFSYLTLLQVAGEVQWFYLPSVCVSCSCTRLSASAGLFSSLVSTVSISFSSDRDF